MMDAKTKAAVQKRLARLEGQVAGLRRMVDEDKYCVDVLVQISAVQGALGRAAQLILGAHVDTCVSAAITSGDPRHRRAKIDELMAVFGRYAQLGR